ncbi:hypothetical protein F5X98DRAFT_390061 [Xylaria grammica]|nr:hypothetical protein F5X98DRAFT_390061 [Xylaria grammica]
MADSITFDDVTWWLTSKLLEALWWMVGGWLWLIFLMLIFWLHSHLIPQSQRDDLENYIRTPVIFFTCCRFVGLLWTVSSAESAMCTVIFPNANIVAQRENRYGNATDFCLYLYDDYGRIKYEQGMKYVSVSHDIKDLGWGIRCKMPYLPAGDWNNADIGSTDGVVSIKTTSCDPLLGVGKDYQWSRDYVNFFDLIIPDATSNTTTLIVDSTKVIKGTARALLKVAGFREDIQAIEKETRIYQHLEGHPIAPKFLGHVTDGGDRVIGLLVEYIEDGRPLEKGMFSDLALERCRDALHALHNLDISHGNAQPKNCLVRRNGETIWVDYEQAKKETYGSFDHDFKALDKGFGDLPVLEC